MSGGNERDKESRKDVDWILDVLKGSESHVLNEDEIISQTEFAIELREARLSHGFGSAEELARGFLDKQPSKLQVEHLRRIIKIWEFARNPHKTYDSEVVIKLTEGISTVEELGNLRQEIRIFLSIQK